MKKLPEITVSFKEIYGLRTWSIRAKLLYAGIKLGIFNHLTEPVSAPAVAEAMGTHPANTGLFLDGLAACDLVTKKDGLYQNAPNVQAGLVEESPTYLGNHFSYGAKAEAYSHNDIVKLVKEGPTQLSQPHTSSDEMTEEDVYCYINYERAVRAPKVVEIASGLPEFASFRKMLDLGCGPGLNGIAVVAAHPTLRGVSFDRPRTSRITQMCIQEYGMADRMEVMSGDYTKDSIGEEYDLIFASDTLYYARDEIDPIMKKIYDALNPGGVFISLHLGLTDERTRPASMVVVMVLKSMMGEDLGLMDQGFLADAMLRAGFVSVRSRTLEMDNNPLDLDIGRKQG